MPRKEDSLTFATPTWRALLDYDRSALILASFREWKILLQGRALLPPERRFRTLHFARITLQLNGITEPWMKLDVQYPWSSFI